MNRFQKVKDLSFIYTFLNVVKGNNTTIFLVDNIKVNISV